MQIHTNSDVGDYPNILVPIGFGLDGHIFAEFLTRAGRPSQFLRLMAK